MNAKDARELEELQTQMDELVADMSPSEIAALRADYEAHKAIIAARDAMVTRNAEKKVEYDFVMAEQRARIEQANATNRKHAAYKTTQAERARQPRLSKVSQNWRHKVLMAAERKLKIDPAIGLNALAESLFLDHGDEGKRGRSRATIRALIASLWHTDHK
jgi:hypothetical protein